MDLIFNRQRPIDQFIVDYFCSELFLAIELDGYTHEDPEISKKDRFKERQMQELGLKVLRFWDEEVYNDLDNVLRVIEITVLERRKKFRV